jgi:hypothetical protein
MGTSLTNMELKLETFDDVQAFIKKILRGSSTYSWAAVSAWHATLKFSRTTRFTISLQNCPTKSSRRSLRCLKPKNFEVIMPHLDKFSALISSFGGDSKLKKRIDDASAKLKRSLLDAVKALHPEHVFKIPGEKSKACSKFLTVFLDSHGKIFSTNYDLLLYWVLMRNTTVEHGDGCGRERENPDEAVPPEEQIWSELTWGKNRETQNVFYGHGAAQPHPSRLHSYG